MLDLERESREIKYLDEHAEEVKTSLLRLRNDLSTDLIVAEIQIKLEEGVRYCGVKLQKQMALDILERELLEVDSVRQRKHRAIRAAQMAFQHEMESES